MPRNYWMIVTSLENFRITRRHGFKVQGIKTQHQRKMQRIEPGDRILYYVGGEQRFSATATAKSRYFEDVTPIWKQEGSVNWNFRVQVQPDVVLDEFEFMDANQLAPRLDYVRRWSPEDWYMAFAQSSLHLLPKKDFQLIEEEMRKVKSKRSPRHRRRPSAVTTGPPSGAQAGGPIIEGPATATATATATVSERSEDISDIPIPEEPPQSPPGPESPAPEPEPQPEQL